MIAHDELAATKGRRLFDAARAADAYVPCDRYGLQVDMNGSFVSLHALMPGRYRFNLPFPVEKVLNLKSGLRERTRGNALDLELQAGETRWYFLNP